MTIGRTNLPSRLVRDATLGIKEKRMRSQGESMGFSGGAEVTPIVKVTRFRAPGTMHDNDPTLQITQGNQSIQLSPGTMQAILAWYNKE